MIPVIYLSIAQHYHASILSERPKAGRICCEI